MRVTGYRDLRPLDWVSGKRMPLEPGEGHICDRCGAEHAVVYELEDTETGKHYSVGSGCVKRQFGFEPDKTKEAKQLIRAVNQQIALDLHKRRHEEIHALAVLVVKEIAELEIPPVVKRDVPNKYTGKDDWIWTCGDAEQRQMHYEADSAARNMVVSAWLRNRVTERVPFEWKEIAIGSRPDRIKSYAERMSELCIKQAMKTLYGMGRSAYY